ncbi:Phage integrase family protein [Falsiruegeria litorea R37]|uniref:Phage integrase family protein n=1 Tax=Falsiruegeria litorea R37 TaxID=1200284 RepID=A0A1Y5SVH0_9RHOB|nr:site-specific integrase [Falsiruegeria litorea]SLN45998.1 Phage integrase family protein [Falsiruegeria litorea R37]
MTKIDTSTQSVLAAIAAQNAWQTSTVLKTPATYDVTASANPVPGNGDTPNQSLKVKHQKAQKNQSRKKFKEPNIARLVTKDGAVSFRVQIRRTVEGEKHSLTKTFKHLPNAKKWRDKKKLEIEVNGFPVEIITSTTIADVIQNRLTRGKDLGRSALQVLNYIKNDEFGKTRVSTLTQEELCDYADLLSAGERTPQTVAGYMTHLARTLNWAKDRGALIPIEVVGAAMRTMWEDEVLARSEERKRRPELWELDKILTAISNNRRQKIPVAILVVFAIYSARRLDEICRLRWEDLQERSSQILVRDMKHPRQKKGNDVWCTLPREALAIIKAMPRTSEYIFPYNSRSIGTAYRRHRDRVGVVDLRFHDFRHEAISRHFEMGMRAAFVSKISGHKNGGCLYRYEHVEEEGDKFVDWPWLQRALEMCKALH